MSLSAAAPYFVHDLPPPHTDIAKNLTCESTVSELHVQMNLNSLKFAERQRSTEQRRTDNNIYKPELLGWLLAVLAVKICQARFDSNLTAFHLCPGRIWHERNMLQLQI